MVRIVQAFSDEFLAQARLLFGEYGRTPGVAPCVQDFEREIAALPGSYTPPTGRLLLAMSQQQQNHEEAIGCGAIRRWDDDTCEMKRLYVRPECRGTGAGRALVNELIAQAKSIGYARIVLDTLPTMKEAHQLYRSLGFREICSYQQKPCPGALFFELSLR